VTNFDPPVCHRSTATKFCCVCSVFVTADPVGAIVRLSWHQAIARCSWSLTRVLA
jgi:hypothetical protein